MVDEVAAAAPSRLTGTEKRLLVTLALAAPMVRAAVRTVALRRLSAISRAVAGAIAAAGKPRQAISPWRLLVLADRAVRATPLGGRCLTRSFLVGVVAAAQGCRSTLLIGPGSVRGRDPWHAWVEVDGVAIDHPEFAGSCHPVVSFALGG